VKTRKYTLELGVAAAVSKHTYQKYLEGRIYNLNYINKYLELGVAAVPDMIYLVPSLPSKIIDNFICFSSDEFNMRDH
jgi:hypothetical protein